MRNTGHLPDTFPCYPKVKGGEVFVAVIQYRWGKVEEVMASFSRSDAVSVIFVVVIKSVIQ